MKICLQACMPENGLITLDGKSRQQIKQFQFFAGCYLKLLSTYYYFNNREVMRDINSTINSTINITMKSTIKSTLLIKLE